jgi:hypothetical protein
MNWNELSINNESLFPLNNGIRRCLVKRFPYGILYGIDVDKIFVVAIMHLHRKPGYWLSRINIWLALFLFPKTNPIILTNFTRRRPADIDAFFLAKLFVDKLLPFHILIIFCRQSGKIVQQEGGEFGAAEQAQILPEMVAAEAGGNDQGDQPFVFGMWKDGIMP